LDQILKEIRKAVTEAYCEAVLEMFFNVQIGLGTHLFVNVPRP